MKGETWIGLTVKKPRPLASLVCTSNCIGLCTRHKAGGAPNSDALKLDEVGFHFCIGYTRTTMYAHKYNEVAKNV